ncbi:phage integrase family protein [Pseudomonas syringae pv. japonica str. M301072]|uniref:Phage integrase family protein n=1 Tax=Pseudomonas syringae pv. japonica str. M301072 TaxID=629262 RepID=F3FJY4_PSESX|nr:tyrosine-type recombinase/integrase [Pseudomonas viridiflava]EGH30520.1 phage integrase family protein [Pseudomonas syringae pv. japonica str. M301072]QXG38179.1 tyrosine-type recombinase/integrase [Pseudomonas viridiflava]
MTVVVSEGVELDLRASPLNDETQVVEGKVTVIGCAVFDDHERILPLVSEFLTKASQTKKLSFPSVKTYGRNLGYLVDHLSRLPEFDGCSSDEILLTVKRPTIAAYIVDLRRVYGIDSVTIRNRDACYRTFYNKFLCVRSDDQEVRRKNNPYAAGFISPSPKRKLVKACSPQELEALVLSTKNERERALLQFIFDAGLRRSEVGRITLDAINKALRFSREQMIVDSKTVPEVPVYCPLFVEGSKGRGGETKQRYSIVSRPTLDRIKKYHATPLYKRYAARYESPEKTPAFFNANGDPFNADAISALLERISERGVKFKRLERSVAPHKLRHGHAYAILNSPDIGKDILDQMVIVQMSLGHDRPDTTDIYTHIPQDMYRTLCGNESVLLTKAETMAQLWKNTAVRIDIRMKK